MGTPERQVTMHDSPGVIRFASLPLLALLALLAVLAVVGCGTAATPGETTSQPAPPLVDSELAETHEQPAPEGAATFVLDQSDPSSVVAALFHAASSRDFSILGDLCDPNQENDGDTGSICELGDGVSDSAEFETYFGRGGINGDAIVQGDRAEVAILFGPEGDREETIVLVRRLDKFYLMSF